ncbi:MAG: hypothetical protein HY047_13655 [Acidobacteria bacterium]|nr:hypothetical protein [Acidobacteriota bacterium]
MTSQGSFRSLAAAALWFVLTSTYALAQSTIAGVVIRKPSCRFRIRSRTVAPFLSSDPNSGGTPTSILQPRIVRIGLQFKF